MSELKLIQIANFASVEPIVPAPNLLNVQPARTESFDAHLQRAQRPGGAGTERDLNPAEADSPPQPADDQPTPTGDRPVEQDTSEVPAENTSTQENEEEVDDARHEQTDSAAADAPVQTKQEPDDQDSQENRKALVTVCDLIGNEGETETSPQDAGAKPQARGAGSQPAALPETPAPDGHTTQQPVAEEKPIVGSRPEILDQSAGQQTEGISQKVIEPTVDQTEREIQATDKQQPTEAHVPETDAPQTVEHQTGDAGVPTERIGEQILETPGGSAAPADTATAAQPDARATPGRPKSAKPTSFAEPTPAAKLALTTDPASAVEPTAAAEPKVDTGDVITKPVADGNPDGRPSPPSEAFASQSARPASPEQPLHAAEPDQVDRVRFVQRVARAFHAVGDRSGSVRLKLSPPELGSLRLEITVRSGAMTARVEAETSTARNLLLDNLPALRDRLAQQNIKIDQFDVNLADRSPGGLPDRTADHAQSHEGDRNNGTPRPSLGGEEETSTTFGRGTASRPGEGTQLNVVI